MKEAIVLSFLLCLHATTAGTVELPTQRITNDQATALVLASLSAEQRRLPKVEAIPDETPDSSKFLFFTVVWQGLPHEWRTPKLNPPGGCL
jgi:hypothetical protein